MKLWAVALAAFVYLQAAHAAQVETVTVEHRDGRYSVSMTVQVAVPAAAAYAVMTDYARLPEVNDSVVSAELLPNNRLRTQVQMCVSFFCRSLDQVQEVAATPPKNLCMTVVPDLSDFSFGIAQWRFMPISKNSSRLFFNAELEPKFWIPPLIGPWLVKRTMREQAMVTSNGIERVARERRY